MSCLFDTDSSNLYFLLCILFKCLSKIRIQASSSVKASNAFHNIRLQTVSDAILLKDPV